MSHASDIQHAISGMVEEAVEENMDPNEIADALDKGEIAAEIDFSELIEEQVALWFDKKYDMVELWAKSTAEHVATGHLYEYVSGWMDEHGPKQQASWWSRCCAWVKTFNWKFWRKKND
tara:strand:- start:89 stop:445 length:357 start_codon:yes stop_codon:yes gene_type:complete